MAEQETNSRDCRGASRSHTWPTWVMLLALTMSPPRFTKVVNSSFLSQELSRSYRQSVARMSKFQLFFSLRGEPIECSRGRTRHPRRLPINLKPGPVKAPRPAKLRCSRQQTPNEPPRSPRIYSCLHEPNDPVSGRTDGLSTTELAALNEAHFHR